MSCLYCGTVCVFTVFVLLCLMQEGLDGVTVVLVGNKSDLDEERQVPVENAEKVGGIIKILSIITFGERCLCGILYVRRTVFFVYSLPLATATSIWKPVHMRE